MLKIVVSIEAQRGNRCFALYVAGDSIVFKVQALGLAKSAAIDAGMLIVMFRPVKFAMMGRSPRECRWG